MAMYRAKQKRTRTSRTTPSARKPQNAARRKKRTATRRRKQTKGWSWVAGRQQNPAKLPGWSDLTVKNERGAGRQRGSAYLEKISTGRFALLILAIAAGFTFYVGHVHATQEILAEAQQARRDNLRLHLKLNRLKGTFDQATGPSVIYSRARSLGLEEGIAYGPTIEMRK